MTSSGSDVARELRAQALQEYLAGGMNEAAVKTQVRSLRRGKVGIDLLLPQNRKSFVLETVRSSKRTP